MVLENVEMSEEKKFWLDMILLKYDWEYLSKKERLEEEIQAHGIGKFLEQVTKECSKRRGFSEVTGLGRRCNEQSCREIATNMLQKGLEVSLISEVTDLSVGYVERLKKNL